METEAGMHQVVWCMSEYKCFCNVLNHVKGPWQRGVLTISSGQLQHALMRNSSLQQPSSYWLDLYTISKITLLNVSGSYIWFTTHNSANCGCDTCRGSPRGSPSGCLSGSRGVRSPSSCAESGPIRCWPDCSASRSQPTQANGVQLFFFPVIPGAPGIKHCCKQAAPAGRQAAVTTAPAPGPEGNTLPVASLSWQILKTWPLPSTSSVILFCVPFCSGVNKKEKRM